MTLEFCHGKQRALQAYLKAQGSLMTSELKSNISNLAEWKLKGTLKEQEEVL